MKNSLNRRRLLQASAGIPLAATIPAIARAQTPEPSASPGDHDHDHAPSHDHGHDTDGPLYLAVADPDAATLTVYAVENMELAGTIDDISLASHAGFLPLADGTLLMIDEANNRLVQVGIDDGAPAIIGEAPISGQVAHIATDSDHAHYCAIGTSGEEEHQLHIVNLESWEVTSLALADAGEVGLMLTHDNLFHRNSELNQVEAYALSDLLDGNTEPLSTVAIGAFGHGEAINPETGELFMATDDGIDVVYWEDPELEYANTLAWPDAEPAARGFFTRLSFDRHHLVTYTSDRSAEESAWHTWKNTTAMYDIATGEATTSDLGDGYTFRFSLAEQSALSYVMGEAGDEALLLDLDPESHTFGTITSRIPLPAMEHAAAPGEPFYEIGQYRATAITPDGTTGFVTSGGDGRVIVLDLHTGSVTSEIKTDSPLTGGGALTIFGQGMPFVDTIGR